MRFYFENYDGDSPGDLDEELLGMNIVTNDNGDLDAHFTCGVGLEHATVAWTESGSLAGAHTYRFEDGALRSLATWVHPRYRRQGLAADMWTVSLNATRAESVRVSCISEAALRLIRQLEDAFPHIDWTVYDETHEELAA